MTPEIPQSTVFDENSVLGRFRKKYQYGMDASRKARAERVLDMRALSEEGPWDAAEWADRHKPDNMRPTPHHDIISQYGASVVNEQRMNPRGAKVIPVGPGATEETVARRAARIRAIEQQSRSKDAALAALQDAVDGGYGYWRVDVEFANDRSMELRIVEKPIPNPDSVVDDPDTEKPDHSDRKFLILVQGMSKQDAAAQYGAKDISSFASEEQRAVTDLGLVSGDRVYLCEFWEVQDKREKLYILEGAAKGIFESELESYQLSKRDDAIFGPDGNEIPVISSRMSQKQTICKYITNGLQVFEKEIWPGSVIPFPGVFGREKWVNNVREIESLTRKLRQPQQAFDLARASEQEQLSIVPKVKWTLSKAAISGYEWMWKVAHRSPLAYLLYNDRDQDGKEIKEPRYQAHEPQVQALELAASSYQRDASNAAGMATAERVDRVARSGLAQQELKAQGQLAQYHFVDSYDRAVEMAARIKNELLDVIEDSERFVGMVSETGQYRMERLSVKALGDGTIQHDYGDGNAHDVVMDTGPSYSTQREEAIDVLRRLSETDLGGAVAPMLVKFMNLGQDGDRLSKVLIAALPAPIQAAYMEEKGKESLSPEAVQQIQQLQQQLQFLDAYAKDAEKKVIELQEQVSAQRLLVESKERISADENATKLAIANQETETERLKILAQMAQPAKPVAASATKSSSDNVRTTPSTPQDFGAIIEQLASSANAEQQLADDIELFRQSLVAPTIGE